MKRSKHSLSHYKLLTCDMGKLIPITCFDVLPGDSVQHATSVLLRCTPLLAPVMHPVQVRVHHWFVPNRLLTDTPQDWENFITGGPDGMDATVLPTLTITPAGGSLADYLGIPISVSSTFSAFFHRAYNLIWNENYRDQDLVAKADPDSQEVRKIAWEKDYFTIARPTPQKGPAVTMPLGTRAPVRGIGKGNQNFGSGATVYETDGTSSASYAAAAQIHAGGSADNAFYVEEDPDNADFPNIWADLAEATSVDVDDVRRAFALQRYQEARSRYGSRYTEYLAYLGVRSSDARLQRPEYLGGGKQTISFSEVLQTGPDTEDEGVANLKGHGIAALRSRSYRRFFEEHGVVMSLLSVRPRTMYANGIPRMFLRTTKEDFWQKELEHIGQQEINRKEIYSASVDTTPFGYADRYAEYRHIQSSIAGDFRNSLDFWHLARMFGSEPQLNSAFVTCVPSTEIFAVPSENGLLVMANHSIQARRLVSKDASGRIL